MSPISATLSFLLRAQSSAAAALELNVFVSEVSTTPSSSPTRLPNG